MDWWRCCWRWSSGPGAGAWPRSGGGVALALGAVLALHPLAVDANPSTYVRPAVPYAAASIVQGEGLYRTHCQACHGVAGYGDGPARRGPRPARPRT